MKLRYACIIAAALAVALYAQSTYQLLVYTNGRLQWATAGPTLSLSSNGQLDAVIPAPIPGPAGPAGPPGATGPQGPPGPSAVLHADVALTYNAAYGGWPLPAPSAGMNIKAVAVYVNGLRYHAGLDYTIEAGMVRAIGANMNSTYFVLCDYWEQ